jgi:CHAT domain-containing protein/tetratricopeptide (TPR) repeat protein
MIFRVPAISAKKKTARASIFAMQDTRNILVDKIRCALEAGEMMDAVEIAQQLLVETRRLGNPLDYYAAELLSIIGNVLAERGFTAMALDSLAEADAEWARYDDDAAKLLWLARNSQLRALALHALGRHTESIAESELALSTYRRTLLGVEYPAVEPEDALDLIAKVAAEVRNVDAESAETLGTITVLIARVCGNLARAHLATGQTALALPWLDVVYRAIDRVDAAQRTLVHLEAVNAYFAFTMVILMLLESGAVGWTEDDLPADIGNAIDRYEALAEEDVNLSQLPGAQSFDTRFLVVQSHLRTEHVEEAYADLETMLVDFRADAFKRATVLAMIARMELHMDRDVSEIERKAFEALNIAEARPDDGKFLVFVCQCLLAEVCLRRRAFADAKRWAALSVIGVLRVSAEGALDPASQQLQQLAQAYRALGNAAAGVFFAKLAAGITGTFHHRLERVVPLMLSKVLPSGHEETTDRLRGYLIEDGRLGEALTAGLLPAEGSLPPTTPAENEFAKRFSGSALSVEKFDRIARNLADVESRHEADRETLQQEQLDRFRDVIPWDDGTTFVHFNPQHDRLQVVIATAESTDLRLITVTSKELAKCVFDFLAALVNETPIESDPYDLLIRPIEERLASTRARRLVIAGADFLRFLPFAALCDGEKYLVERYATVSWSPFATRTLKQSPRSRARVVLFGYARGRDAFDELETVPDELSAIAAACESNGRAVVQNSLLDADFNRERLAAAIGGTADAVHLATHFHADSADARKARLVLGDDTFIEVGDLAEFAAKGNGLDLITLAACSTGFPVARAAEVNVSAAATLHTFGTRSVVSTLWSVHSVSTTLIMEHFYRALFAAAPRDKAEALREAQLALLHGNDLFSHPHHWAPFVLSGNWAPFPE